MKLLSRDEFLDSRRTEEVEIRDDAGILVGALPFAVAQRIMREQMAAGDDEEGFDIREVADDLLLYGCLNPDGSPMFEDNEEDRERIAHMIDFGAGMKLALKIVEISELGGVAEDDEGN